MSDHVIRVAAVIQKRSVARCGRALTNDVCLDFAEAALAEVGIITLPAGDGIHGTDEICGELSEGV